MHLPEKVHESMLPEKVAPNREPAPTITQNIFFMSITHFWNLTPVSFSLLQTDIFIESILLPVLVKREVMQNSEEAV